MPKVEECQLRPLGWENDPEEERFHLSILDYLAACTWNSYAVFFKLDESEKTKVAAVLKEGLERTLAQARHLVGTIEKNPDDDDHSFVKRKDTTVKFVTKWLDAPEDNFPHFSELEKTHFVSSSLGNVDALCVEGMTYGEKPECHPNAHPVIAAFQANFIPGGLIFNMHSHHYANDVMGWANFTHQLADNCRALVKQTDYPSWDPACLDTSRFRINDIPEEAKVAGPTPPDRNPSLLEFSSLLFHLPKSKAEALKKAATPEGDSWISTYDAFSAFLWRILTKHRAEAYKTDLASTPLWGEAVNMRTRLDPPVPKRMMTNVFFAALSTTYPEALTTSEIISEVPLSRLASYIRTLTNGTTQEGLKQALAMVAPIRDKTSLFIRINSFAPLSIVMTDWRETKVCEADFGFAKPSAFRHLFDALTEGLIIVYPPRSSDPNSDEGNEFVISVEKVLVKPLTEDPEMQKYFEFRGFDLKEADNPPVGFAGKLP